MAKKQTKFIICKKCGAKNNKKRKKCRKCSASLQKNYYSLFAVCVMALLALIVLFAALTPKKDASLPKNDPSPFATSDPSIAAPTPSIKPTPTPEVTASPTPTAEPERIKPSVPTYMLVNDEYIFVYQSPDVNSEVIGAMGKDSIILIRYTLGEWAEIENETGIIGYVLLKGLQDL